MNWTSNDHRKDLEEMLATIGRQASDIATLAEQARRDMGADRFSSFLSFRKKVGEMRALMALTEERLNAVRDSKITDLQVEFERLDILITVLLAKSTRDCFANMHEDQPLPIGARELFEPELRILEESRVRLSRPHYADRVVPSALTDLDEAAALIKKIIQRAPSLPDFTDAPAVPKAMRRLPDLARPIRNRPGRTPDY